MKQFLVEHGAHLVFVLIGVVAFFWMAYRPERDAKDRPLRDAASRPREPLPPPAATPAPSHVRRSVARRGLLALGPLLGAVATGAILYGMGIGRGPVPGAVIWVHSGISALALLLVAYKVADSGVTRLRRAFARERLPELVSLALGAVSVPLAVTGLALLFAPSTASFFAYTHLISSVWWTGLLAWHLRRYLGPSLRAAMRPASADRGRPVPAAGRGEGLERRAA
ncbi:MAG TPA: hypothetical protein VEF89_11795 [Solirubrobacteraceae bacterium]|nr:hypothetical protein [Solirubrobacteraceae bacterium]